MHKLVQVISNFATVLYSKIIVIIIMFPIKT